MPSSYLIEYSSARSWKLKVKIICSFHKNKKEEYGDNWTIRMTSEYFGVSVGLVSENLRLGEKLDKFNKMDISRNLALKMIKES